MDTFPLNPALEAAVVANADEDTPRLAYADWLDEHGDPDRAEFIRVQVAIANSSPADDAWFDLLERETNFVHQLGSRLLTVWSAHQDQLLAVWNALPKQFYFGTHYFPGLDREEKFQRGFPFFCQVQNADWNYKSTEQFADALAQLVSTTTFRGIYFYSIQPARFAELVATPAFSKLRGLAFTLRGQSAWQSDFETLAYRKLTESAAWQSLTHLSIHGGLGTHAVKVLASTERPRSLRHLSIQYPINPSTELPKFMSSDCLQGLRDVECCLGDPEGASMMVAGLGELPELHTLSIRDLAPTTVPAVVSGRFSQLRSVKTWGSNLKTMGFLPLLRAPWFENLRALDVSGSDLSDKAVIALTKHPVAHSLRRLRLTTNTLTKSGLMAFARHDAFPKLLELGLHSVSGKKSKITEDDVLAFLAALNIPQLRELDLGGLPVGDAGAKLIASTPTFGSLRRLAVMFSGIGKAGEQALAESPYLRKTSLAIPEIPQ